MSIIFSLLSFASLVFLVVGLAKPSILQKIFKKIPSRKNITILFGSIAIAALIVAGATTPPTTKNNNTDISSSQNVADNKADVEPSANNAAEQVASTSSSEGTNENMAGQNQPIGSDTPSDNLSPLYSISSVVDGDTVKVNIDGTIVTLRLIGLDTPETVDPRKTVQCFGKEASDKAKELLTGKKVRLEADASQGELDKYGRRLAYIYREDGLFYNKYMIEQGYAHEYTYNTPYKYQAEFKAAQKSAQDNLRGLWSPDTCNGDTTQSAESATVSSSDTSTSDDAVSTPGTYYTSSYGTTKYYYPESCDGWKTLSTKYLKSFDSLEALLAGYPSRTLSPQCD
ncbi:MAG: thermonuclease family protein [Patescibacteria group bacterium]|nr:thermonuclease family protein [Patescibacteria group bacterium]